GRDAREWRYLPRRSWLRSDGDQRDCSKQSSAKTASNSTIVQVPMSVMDWLPSWIPPWLVGAVTMIAPAAVVLMLYRWFTRRLIRLARRYSPVLQKLLARGQGP